MRSISAIQAAAALTFPAFALGSATSLPLYKRAPENVATGRFNRNGLVVARARRQPSLPTAGEPGRPYARALQRAYAEDAARKAPKAKRPAPSGHLPKATKLDVGSLAGGHRYTHLNVRCIARNREAELQLSSAAIAVLATKGFFEARIDHLHARARDRIQDARAEYGR